MKLTIKKLIKFECILSLAIVVFTLLKQINIVSFCFFMSFLVIALATLMVINKKSSCKFLLVVISVLTVTFVSCNMIITGIKPTTENIVFVLVFIALLVYMYLMLQTEVDFSFVNWIMNFGLIFSACFSVSYYLGGIKTYSSGYLSMNFSNSNLLGMWILQAIIFSIIGFFWYRSILKKLICIILTVANLNLLILSGTRNAILSLILGAAIIVLHILTKHKYSKILLAIIALVPILFLTIYMGTVSIWSNSDFSFPFFFEIDKGIDSRYLMWRDTLYSIKGHILIGAYFNMAGNVHNSHLVVLASYGIVVLGLTILYLYKIMEKANENCETLFQKVCISGFFITLFMGIGEGALFSGALGLYIPACIYIALARYRGKCRKE